MPVQHVLFIHLVVRSSQATQCRANPARSQWPLYCFVKTRNNGEYDTQPFIFITFVWILLILNAWYRYPMWTIKYFRINACSLNQSNPGRVWSPLDIERKKFAFFIIKTWIKTSSFLELCANFHHISFLLMRNKASGN